MHKNMQIENRPLGYLAFLSETIYLTCLGFCCIIHILVDKKVSQKQHGAGKIQSDDNTNLIFFRLLCFQIFLLKSFHWVR